MIATEPELSTVTVPAAGRAPDSAGADTVTCHVQIERRSLALTDSVVERTGRG